MNENNNLPLGATFDKDAPYNQEDKLYCFAIDGTIKVENKEKMIEILKEVQDILDSYDADINAFELDKC